MFKIKQKGNEWAMTIEMDLRVDVLTTDFSIEDLAQELENYPSCRRMSYDTWYWQNHDDLNSFVTYFLLKWD